MSGAIPPLSQYAFMAWCLVKHRDNFTFTFTFLSLKIQIRKFLLPFCKSLLSSRHPSENLRVKIYENLISPVLLYEYETWSLTQGEEHTWIAKTQT